MITALTHTTAEDMHSCAHCHVIYPRKVAKGVMITQLYEPGTRIGVITTTHGGDSVYVVGKNDSNQPCTH